jgi:hypothetical protein
VGRVSVGAVEEAVGGVRVVTGAGVAFVDCAVAVVVGGTGACTVTASVDTSDLDASASVTDGVGGSMGLSSRAGAAVEATAFDSKPVEGAEAEVSTSGGLFRPGFGGTSAADVGSSTGLLTVCSGVIILVQGGSKGQTKGNKTKSRAFQGVNGSSHYMGICGLGIR